MDNKLRRAIGAIAGIVGFCVVGFTSSWWIAIGVFIMIFGNNVERNLRT